MRSILWPENWPEYRNGGILCDVLVGYCSCGAQHQPGEFAFEGGNLYRYSKNVLCRETTLEELKKQRDALDSKIKKLQKVEKMKSAVSFTIYPVQPGEPLNQKLYIDDVEQVRKLKHFLTGLLNDE